MKNDYLWVGITSDGKVIIQTHVDGEPLAHIILDPDSARAHAKVVVEMAQLAAEPATEGVH